MEFASAPAGSVSLGSVLVDPGASDALSLRPILTELNGIDSRLYLAMDSLEIQDTLGQPVTANFLLVSPTIPPVVGNVVRIKFFEQVIFAGTIDHVEKTSPDLTTFLYRVDCLDWSQVLYRRKLRRNFTGLPVQNIIDSLLDNELLGEGLTIGRIDTLATMPLVDARSARVFDVVRDIAGATGQTTFVEFDKSIQMRSTTVPVAPLVLNEANTLLDAGSVKTDRETYRNVQTVIVTGTPPENTDALETTQQRRNEDQISARAAIEGGTGIYEEIEEITHPTSNDGADIALLGISYARLRLATSGTPRQTFTCQVRGYGFRAGQIATVNLPTFGLVGTFIIQRVTIQEHAGQFLFHTLELTNSSLQQRAYEAWLSIVKGGKVTVQMPGSITANLQSFNTPGNFTWTVPANTFTAEFTTYGPSGGGSGAMQRWIKIAGICKNEGYADGGRGGNSGRAVTIQAVLPGQIWDVHVGAAGIAGLNGNTTNINGSLSAHPGLDCEPHVDAIDGSPGGSHSSVSLAGVVSCQGNLGLGGLKAAYSGPGSDGTDGSGIGDAISVGGGKTGGAKGVAGVNPHDGSDGLVEVRW